MSTKTKIANMSMTKGTTIARAFGVADKAGREFGAKVNTFTVEMVPQDDPTLRNWGYDLPVGTAYGYTPHATRAGKSFGPIQHYKLFASAAERDAAVEKYFADAAKRAAKNKKATPVGATAPAPAAPEAEQSAPAAEAPAAKPAPASDRFAEYRVEYVHPDKWTVARFVLDGGFYQYIRVDGAAMYGAKAEAQNLVDRMNEIHNERVAEVMAKPAPAADAADAGGWSVTVVGRDNVGKYGYTVSDWGIKARGAMPGELVAIVPNGVSDLEPAKPGSLESARLISAAPELLAAVVDLLNWAESVEGQSVSRGITSGGLFDLARAAIAKARGK